MLFVLTLLSFSQPFLTATLWLSQKKTPLLHEVIPVIDLLTNRLEDVSTDAKYLPSIRAGAAKGLAVLNKYYSKTDESVMYRCTMSMFRVQTISFLLSSRLSSVLHPKYKLSYFRSKNWPEEWIDAARAVLREQWSSYYKPHNDSELDPSSQLSSSSVVHFSFHYDSK